jgi:hypothetical protein
MSNKLLKVKHSIIMAKAFILGLYVGFTGLVTGCSENHGSETDRQVTVERVGGLELVRPDMSGLGEFMGELVVKEEEGMAYGIDLRSRTAYRFSLTTGEVEILAPQGRGPGELSMPAQIINDLDGGIMIYDNPQDHIVAFDSGTIVFESAAYASHDVSARGYAAYAWEGSIISAIKDPEVYAGNYDEVQPLAIFDYRKGELEKAGRFSSTADRLDSDSKYPILFVDQDNGKVLYLMRTDYTLLSYDMNSGLTTEVAGYKPPTFRDRTVEAEPGRAGSIAAAMALGTNRSYAIGLYRIDDRVMIVWQNFNEGFYENLGDYSAGSVDYFGVLYDLPGYDNPVEFRLPGRLLGVFRDQLLIEEDYGAPELKIGFYTFR